MLDPDSLADYIEYAVKTTLAPALRSAYASTLRSKTKESEEMADKFAATFAEIAAPKFAQMLAYSIDCYIKKMEIFGPILTFGSAVSQTATIVPQQIPSENGIIPNSLGVK